MQKQRSWQDYLKLSSKGMLMGAADAVPGVSGGTIAFMTGIYEELIYSLKQCGPEALSVLFKQGFAATWQHINGNFLLTLVSGILLSVLTLSRVILFWLDVYPIMLWSFFFGLIVAAIWSLIRHVEKWNVPITLAFVIGTVAAYLITSITPTSIEPTKLFIFVSGMIAICAMILPGISGSFILLLLGMYSSVLLAVKEFQFVTLSIFASGCIVVWPWKNTLETTINRHGKEIPLVQQNVLPDSFELLTGQESFLFSALALMILGVVMVVLLEKLGSKE
jgi:putative membrane protein